MTNKKHAQHSDASQGTRRPSTVMSDKKRSGGRQGFVTDGIPAQHSAPMFFFVPSSGHQGRVAVEIHALKFCFSLLSCTSTLSALPAPHTYPMCRTSEHSFAHISKSCSVWGSNDPLGPGSTPTPTDPQTEHLWVSEINGIFLTPPSDQES